MIRELTEKDRERAEELLRQLWSGESIEPGSFAEVMKKYIEAEEYRAYGYEDDGLLIGIITVSVRSALFYGGKVAIIEDLAVDEFHRRRGIGLKLVRYVEKLISKDRLVKGIEVNSDLHRKKAQAFWDRCGYSKLAFQFRKELGRDTEIGQSQGARGRESL